ncbi:MAG: undecaprenyl/decaprenyl-phosphate alpha-N-acetylglucosaminyl 1-phosphate transferase [Pseudomonadales bacterium]|nr:undecaprenyl/decaprenyl-phosphate alpha-N-acetylglucosaminyl 1-phosphate transferase [Pseudomonadales bacterium]
MWALFFSFTIALLIAPLLIALYTNYGWVDDPATDTHVKKTHSKPVPRGGGLVIFGSFLVSAMFLLEIDKYLIAICVAALLLTIVGVLDDIFDIDPKIRLITGLTAAGIVVAAGIGIAYVSNPFGDGVFHLNQPQIAFHLFGELHTIWVLADIFALIFILWNMNSVNWSKGVDGQLPSFVSVAMIVIALLSGRYAADPTLFDTTTFSYIIAGSFLGLLVWNWYPQRMMPGYGAGSLAGFFLGVAAIISGAKVATVVIVLGVPTADALFTIARRLARGKSPLWGDRGHLHHILLDYYHLSRKHISLIYVGTTLGLGLAALYLNTVGKMITMAVVCTVVFFVHIHARKIQKAKR